MSVSSDFVPPIFANRCRGAAVKLQHRRAVPTDDLDAGPEDALRLSGAEGLHGRLLRGKASGERRAEVPLAAAIGDFALGEHASDEAVAVLLIASSMRSISVASSPVPIMVIVSGQSYTSLPQVSDGFEWTDESWGAALRCRPLAAVAPHLFTTRQLELSSPAHVRALTEAVGARDVAMVTQVHGRGVVVVRRGATAA